MPYRYFILYIYLIDIIEILYIYILAIEVGIAQ